MLKRQALQEAALAGLELGRFGEVEAAARALLALPLRAGAEPDRDAMDNPAEAAWGRVLLAQAAVTQGRRAEALQTLEPALADYRNELVQGATHLSFRQHFARALYVQALAHPAGSRGAAQARDSLDQAAGLLNALSEEARQLHNTKELISWVGAARKKLNGEAPQP